jgi:hypothetical protein
MIRYDEVKNLEGEQAERVSALIDRSFEIWDMPEDLGKIEAWEQQAADCEAEGVPHLAASARFGQYTTYLLGGLPNEALEAYARLMQIIARYGDHIHPENLERFLGSVSSLADTLVDDPRVPLERIERVIGLVEETTKARGLNLADIWLAQAVLAAEKGDATATFDWLDRWHAAGSEGWTLDYLPTTQIETAIVMRVDPARALQLLEERFARLGVRPGPLDPNHPEVDELAGLRARLALLYARVGRRDVAATIGGELREQFGGDWMIRNIVVDDALTALEAFPEDAQAGADWTLSQLLYDGSDWSNVAAAARTRLLAEPEGEEGELLRAVALEGARRSDERSGSDVSTREVTEFWFAGLPEGPRPAVLDDAEVWDDPEERALAILKAGWFPRHADGVTLEDSPIALKDRFVEVSTRPMAIIEAASSEEADALTEEIYARANDVHLTSATFGARLFRALYAGTHGDFVGAVEHYAVAQEELSRTHATVQQGLLDSSFAVYPTIVELGMCEPKISLDRISQLMYVEHELRERLDAPTVHLAVAQAVVASYLGDAARLQTLAGEVTTRAEAERDDTDQYESLLQLVRLAEPYAPQYAATLARAVFDETTNPEQQRAALAWTAWFLRGEQDISRDVLDELESIDRDVESFGNVPGWVLLESLLQHPEARSWAIDAVESNIDNGVKEELATYAVIARALGGYQIDPERADSLRAEVLSIASELDARNGNTYQSTMLRGRWLGNA